MIRQTWIDKEDAVSVVQQCIPAGVSRATVYARQESGPVDESDLLLSRADRRGIHTASVLWQPQDGCFPQDSGHTVNRKRLQRLMRQMGLAGMSAL